MRDGLGRTVTLHAPPRRIVSLVPSLTEALFACDLREEIVGVTRYCVAPADLIAGVPKVGGTKTPDLAAIIRLRPDLVVASAEENVREHIESLIEQGLTVYVSLPATVRRALRELHDLAELTGRVDVACRWLTPIEERLKERERAASARRPVRYFCPIWRRPYMVAGPHTYMSDLLRLCGGESIFGSGPARYYAVDLAEAMARGPEIVLLPSEPYPFAEQHRAEVLAYADVPAVRAGRVHLVEGQHITWYGPRLGEAMRVLSSLFDQV